jgi:hypothetical protein
VALAAHSQCYRPAWRATTPQCNTISRILIHRLRFGRFPPFPWAASRRGVVPHNPLSSALSSLIDDLIERGRAPAVPRLFIDGSKGALQGDPAQVPVPPDPAPDSQGPRPVTDLRRRGSRSIHPFEVQAGTDLGESRARRRRVWPSKSGPDWAKRPARPYRRTRFPRYGLCRGGSDTDRSGMVCRPLP